MATGGVQLCLVEAHGTGTALGDPIEAGALAAVFLSQRGRDVVPLAVGSLKANAGHTEPGAGLAGALKLATQLQRATMPSNAQLRVLNAKVGSAMRAVFDLLDKYIDADDPVYSSADSDSDSDDDTAVLMAELNKIKAEKARDDEEKEMRQRDDEEQIRMENIYSGNPLLKEKYAEEGKGDMKIKKRWDDDVVFKNCSRAEPDDKEKTFINDSLRNEFHRKFMDKYVK